MASSTAEPQRHRLTVRDYYRMAEVGILAPDARVELIDGEIIDMAPPGSLHAGTVTHLARLLGDAVGTAAIVQSQNPLTLGSLSEPQPDIALLRPRADFYKTSHPTPADVLLVIEVANSSLAFDRKVKIPLYARHAVPEVWLVELANRRVVRHRAPEPTGYRLVDELDLSPPVDLPSLPGVRASLGALFD
jgi:Uma2 family endonuclease